MKEDFREMTRKDFLKDIPFSVIIITTLSALMLYFTGLIPAPGEWYSFDQSLRLQTEAFLRGELAIQPVPYGHRHDWAWGNGMHQVWGLGVPIIQLPFHVMGKLFNSFGFPDRITFLAFYSFVAALFWRSLDSYSGPEIDGGERLKKRIQNIPILLFAFLNPALIIMMRAKYGPYEEVISYAYLWSLMLFSLMLVFLKKGSGRLYLLICLLSGLALNIRPTIGAYGGATFLIASYLAWRRKVRPLWAGLPLFLAGMSFFFAMNYLRFGNPIEPGYRLALTNSAYSDYVVRFDNTLNWVPFWSAALELLSAMFFLDLYKFHSSDHWLLWKVSAPRVREINFKPYYSFELVLLLLSWAVFFLLLWRRRKDLSSAGDRDEIISPGIVWSFFSFSMLFIFYSICPGLISRYLVDFGPAVIIGIVMLFIYLNGLIRARLPEISSFLSCTAMSAAAVVLIFASLMTADIAPLYRHLDKVELTNVTGIRVAKEKLLAMRHMTGPSLPSIYNCRDMEKKYDIPYNNSGWSSSNCMVQLATTHFFEAPRCIGIYIEPIAGAPDWVKREYSDDEIEVKMGIESMRREGESPFGSGKVITFCSKGEGLRRNPDYSKAEMISIKWLDWRKHPRMQSIPFSLESVRKLR